MDKVYDQREDLYAERKRTNGSESDVERLVMREKRDKKADKYTKRLTELYKEWHKTRDNALVAAIYKTAIAGINSAST